MAKILITGGTGLIGNHLIPKLIDNGHEVALLSRKAGSKKINNQMIECFQWNPSKGTIDESCLNQVDYIIHLAGKSINSRWTKSNKKKIIDSRVKGAQLLIDTLKNQEHQVKKFISASGIGYYGETYEKSVNEHAPAGNDFAAKVCVQWEGVLNPLKELGIVKTIFRLGIVLSNKGGAFKAMKTPFQFGLGSAIGSGQQFISWVHIDDACNAFLQAIEDDDTKGTFNLVAPNASSNHFFSKTLAQSLNRPFFMPNIPIFALQMIMGEKSNLLLIGTRASADKLLNTGFAFQFDELGKAMDDLNK